MDTPITNISDKTLTDACRERLNATHVEVVDVSGGCGQSFEVKIVSPVFEGVSMLQRHRMVNSALKDEISCLHAFSQKTYTPSQWNALQ
ncbi:bola protein [Mortierella sp. GBAus27b]|nr:bola protein [Mortierella sp. GBAus27b]